MSSSRPWLLWAAGVALGFVGGVVATLAVVGVTRSPPEPPAAGAPLAAGTPSQVPNPNHAPPPDPDRDPDPDLAQVLAGLEAASDPLSGPAPDWSPDAAYRPPTVRSTLEAAFPDTDIRVDCREFPCIGVIETGPEVPADLADDIETHGFARDAYGEIGDQLAALGLDDPTLAVHQAALDGGGYRILVAWLSKERDAELSARLKARIDWLAEHGASAVGE